VRRFRAGLFKGFFARFCSKRHRLARSLFLKAFLQFILTLAYD
jgi:hypothetical protein